MEPAGGEGGPALPGRHLRPRAQQGKYLQILNRVYTWKKLEIPVSTYQTGNTCKNLVDLHVFGMLSGLLLNRVITSEYM